MKSVLTDIALANAFYEQKKNYFDAYFPFILRVFEKQKVIDISKISKELLEVFNINLPIHSIRNILSEKNGNIITINKKHKSNWLISLTVTGESALAELLDNERKIDRRMEIFYSSCIDFSEKLFGVKYNRDKIVVLIRNFLINHLIEVSVHDNIAETFRLSEIDGFEKIFILFLDNIRKTSDEKCQIFEELWKGVVIWNELSKKDIYKKEKNFENDLFVYLDTNLVISLLELHNPLVNQSANELYDLLLSNPKIKLRVLDVTISEIENLLSLYDYFKDDFNEIEVDSVFYYMKKNGFDRIKINKLKKELPSILSTKSITVERVGSWDDTLQKYYPYIYEHIYKLRIKRNEHKDTRMKKNVSAIEKSAHHDSVVLSYILSKKNKSAVSIYNARAIFLTSSFYLVKNYEKITNRFEKYPSIIMDSTFTNHLYLLSPEKNCNLKLNQVLKAHSKYLIVNTKIWQDYINTLKRLMKDEDITFEDYCMLISDNPTVDNFLKDEKIVDIDEEKVEKLLEEIKEKDHYKNIKIEEYEQDKVASVAALEKRENELSNLTKRIDILERQKAIEALEKDNEIKNLELKNKINEEYLDILNTAGKKTKRMITFFLFAIIVKVAELIIGDIEFLYRSLISNIVAIILFIIPLVISCFQHEKIIRNLRLTFSIKYRKHYKTILEGQRTEENYR